MTLTPELIEAWTKNGIVSRFFPNPDTCEETVNGHPDKVFVQERTGDLTWKLVSVRSVLPVTPDSPKLRKLTKKQERYAQYE